jgi:hypothetical protein
MSQGIYSPTVIALNNSTDFCLIISVSKLHVLSHKKIKLIAHFILNLNQSKHIFTIDLKRNGLKIRAKHVLIIVFESKIQNPKSKIN